MSNKHLKRCFTLLTITEMDVKSKCSFVPFRMAKKFLMITI